MEITQEEHDAAEEAVAKDIIERGLVEQLIQVKKPAPKELDDFKAFVEDCRAQSITAIPATPHVVAAYLLCRITADDSERAVVRAAAAIDYAHDVSGYAPPCGHSSVRAVLKLNREHSRKQTEIEGSLH